MKLAFILLLAAACAPAWGQASRPDLSRALYREANLPAAALRLRAELDQHPTEFLAKGTYEAGYLRTLDGRRILLAGLRYHVGQRVLQAQDSVQADSTHYWPLAAIRGFDLGLDDDAPLPTGAAADAPPLAQRYRARLVQAGRQAPHREAVQVLTTIDSGPLLLAWLPTVAEPASHYLMQVLVAGPGLGGTEPLHPLDLTQAAVLRLCGSRAEEVRTFATARHLRYDQPTEVAKMLDYYNRVAVAK
ncbi:hypothetical protein QMK33_01535 [Hymenobacter sp. H14-R3]|uniref:hypothetical protein n=1 Tax=Hymenobacter sp. H14-R3 TaxID=3046308 RepID=UPI0024B9F110|nr:hypothetical protein [Hymenobacter sp. H14-R3]MDJ0363817.1 hypothetical protein [Hymenobacter sp. H14-R3]